MPSKPAANSEQPHPRIRIAIDGPAGSGKGTAARAVAQALDFAYVDTGAMYRVVGLLAHEAGVSVDDGPACGALAAAMDLSFAWRDGQLQVVVNGRDVSTEIRTEVAGRGASDVSRHPPVRDALLGQQRALAARGGVVMEGRDIGTVVLPDAELKIYLDASVEERAQRRYAELLQRGVNSDLDDVARQIRERDHQDMNRATAPLRKADDAVVVDSTGMDPAVVCDRIVALARQRG